MTGDQDPPDDDQGKTVFVAPTPRTAPPQSTPPPPVPPVATVTALPVSAQAGPGGRVEIGAVLNNIYEVKRLIARGGMGEVFEGVNINDDHDRVAIKVMLPALAADPNVQAMFRKEARTLTRLSHPAVVQYRVLAQEPTLGVFYIVTEFIDGQPLSDYLGKAPATSDDLRALTRRLAEGLKAAHDLGAVHRDMSPDNVLLPDGLLERAKIIDFGIAKEMDPSKATIVGDGFAGKLGYVAPEQLGDFGREVGPWSDVYSLGLVIVTLAAGKGLDMGVTLVDAVDKRRAGVDLTSVPADIRPVLERMLAPDPALRARSMDEVLAMLAGAPSMAPTLAPPAGFQPKAKSVSSSGSSLTRRWPLLAVGGGVAVLAVGGLALFSLSPKTPPPGPPAPIAQPTTNAEIVRGSIEMALGNVPCSWLDVAGATAKGAGVGVKLTGVAASPQAAQSAVTQAAQSSGVKVPDVDLLEVLTAPAPTCAMLDAFRPVRANVSVSGGRLATSQTRYTLEKQPDGTIRQIAVITMAIRDPSLDFAIFGLEQSGEVSVLAPSRQAFVAFKDSEAGKQTVVDMGADNYRLSIWSDQPGLDGVLLITGHGPFDPRLIGTPPAQRNGDWASRVHAAAQAGGWKAEMVWYRMDKGVTP